MIIKRLELVDFRNHKHTVVELQPGRTVLIGKNGQGKTNFVEAIRYLSTLESHRVAGYLPLIRQKATHAVVRSVATANNREVTVELVLNRDSPNQATINKNQVARVRDILGLITSVTFAPEDLDVVKRDPGNRRAYLDECLVLLTPRMAGVFSDYARVLKQRNALLKSARQTSTSGTALSTLDAWDEQLVRYGSEIIAARVDLIGELEPHVMLAYESIADRNNKVLLGYESSILAADIGLDESAKLPQLTTSERDVIAKMFHEKLADVRSKELERGLTLVGPQRDEMLIQLGELPAKGYASHGESWSLALALRLGGAQLVRAKSSVGDPILILDDVFAELDDDRRSRLAAMISGFEQVLITAASAEDVPAELEAHRLRVSEGVVISGDK